MPRRTNSEQKFSLREPEDIIDLTQDSPSNVALRRSRSHVNHDVQVAAIDTEDVEPVHIEDANPNNRSQSRTQRNNQPTVVINLEDTINLDDTPCCINEANQVSVLPVSSPSYKRGLSCPICLENLADENIKPMTTPCGHVYCLDCLKTITRAKKKCSLCQRPITFSKCIRLHI